MLKIITVRFARSILDKDFRPLNYEINVLPGEVTGPSASWRCIQQVYAGVRVKFQLWLFCVHIEASNRIR